MNCPKCGNELRRSKKDPSYGLCDVCRKKYHWDEIDEEDEYEFDEPKVKHKRNRDSSEIKGKANDRNYRQNNKKKKKNKKLGIIFLIIGIVICMGSCASMFGSGDSKKADKSDNNKEPEMNLSSSKDEDDKSTDDKRQKEIPDLIKVGDDLENNDIRIVYMASGNYTSDNMFSQPKDGYKYIFIKLYFENLGKSDKMVSMFNFDCYADGYSCDQYFGGEDDFSDTLSAGRYVFGNVYFEVPEDAKDDSIEIEYDFNIFSDKKLKFLYEGDKDSGFEIQKNTAVSENAYDVGSIIEDKNLRISYLSCGRYESDNQFVQPKEGNHFVTAEFEFENLSKSDQYISSGEFDCFADGKSCKPTFIKDDDLSVLTLSSGRKAKGSVSFEIPDDAETIEIEYLTNLWTSGRLVFKYQE